jgi:hypothetical protein
MRDTIDMAREAGFDLDGMANMLYTVRGNHAQLALFEALVRADEREACAKVVESYGTWFTTETVAAAIRAR